MNMHRLCTGLALVAIVFGASAQQAARKPYVIQLADAPAASYTGTVSGYVATQPARGQKINVNATHVRSYLNYLDAQRNNALSVVGSVPVLHRYGVAFNGFSALLTDAEVQKLRSATGVVAVTADEPRQLDTTRTPAFMGLSGPGGLWTMTDGAGRLVKGEDVIVGIVDGGVWPENASFSDKVDALGLPVPSHMPGTVVYGPPPAKWKGTCQTGAGFSASHCNNKLIGARYFDASFKTSGETLHQSDFVSPRDQGGHGTHTASTAAGNSGVQAFVNGSAMGAMSGVAPRARVAAYKVCWTFVDPSEADGSRNSCFLGDSVKAIDTAVADGVDVINYSISGTQTNFLDPVEVAFLNATAAGVYVATSAGNSGPANRVAHISPWLTAVAATTHDRLLSATLTLGNGTSYAGPSLSQGLAASPMVNATAAAAAGAAAEDAARCFPGTLDPAKAAGRIVVCDRGVNARVEKSQTVKDAGGVGMVLLNVPGGASDLADDAHFVPSVHLASSAHAAVHAYAATVGASASMGVAVQTPGVIAPVMASFSSRGPNRANRNILKPDIAAPGVAILAAYAYQPVSLAEHDAIANGTLVPPGASEFLQGTSMASPHIAGVAALMKQLRPTWSPAAIKSALMTSAGPVKLANGAIDTNRWGYGAGQVNPNGAAATSLVYDAGPVDYLQFLCGVGALSASSSTCRTYGPIAPQDLNLASITTEVLGRASVRRTVTNLGNATSTYVASTALPGYTAVVEPATITLAPGASASYELKLTRTSAPVNAWSFGDVVWSDGVNQVKSPLSAFGTLLAAPRLVSDTRIAGAKVFTIGTGYTGTIAIGKAGLTAATRTAGSVAQDASTCFDFAVPAGRLYARFALFDSDTTGQGMDDLDLEIYRDGALVGTSGGATSTETVEFDSPAAGGYRACVVGYAPKGGTSNFTLSSWVIAATDAGGNLRAAGPSKVYLGGTATVAASWNVVTPARYMGVLTYSDGGGAAVGRTIVSIDTSAAATPTASALGANGDGRKALERAKR